MFEDQSGVMIKLWPQTVSIRNKYLKNGSVLNADIERKNFLKSIAQNAQIFQREHESFEMFRKVGFSKFSFLKFKRMAGFWKKYLFIPLFQIRFHRNQRCKYFGTHFLTILKLLQGFFEICTQCREMCVGQTRACYQSLEWETNEVNVSFFYSAYSEYTGE